MRTLSSSSWIDRWEGSRLVAPADIMPEKGRVSACNFLLKRGKEGEEGRVEGGVGVGGEEGETVNGRVYAAMSSWASFKHFHVYNPIQSQHIQYYIGDPSLLS